MSATFKNTGTDAFSTESASYNTSCAAEFKSSSSKSIKLGKNTQYIAITLTDTGETFKADDVIYISGYNTWAISTDASKLNSNSDVATSVTTGTSKTDINVGSFKLPAGTYGNTLYLSRATGNGTVITNIVIKR